MLSNSPLLDLVRAGAFVMLLFAAILIAVVIRNLEAPIKFGTRIGPVLVGVGLVLFALPIYGSVMATQILDRPSPFFRILAGILLPVGLYLMKPLTRHSLVPREVASEETLDGD